jgi:crotonobetainyl-CoA:carnitine CoA-transferase CaiB-like acyl-CoA transferase
MDHAAEPAWPTAERATGSAPGDTAAGPLAGVRVVELAMWVAGPSAAGVMADWGADVIKVEPPGGDPQRQVFGAIGVGRQHAVPPFEVDNRGKRSVVLDLTTNRGRQHLERLIAAADVFVTNLRPAALERLGLDHGSLLGRYPALVYGCITGYGLDGPDRDRAGYDAGAFWARSGLAHTFAPPGELGPALRAGMGDHITGMTLAAGVTAKLVERARTGRGGLAATSLLRTGMYSIAWDFGVQLRFGRRERTRARHESRTPLTNSYLAGDGRGFWLICLEVDRHWPKLAAAIGREDLAADPRFAGGTAQRAHSVELIAELDAVFATRPYHEWASRFDAADVWYAPINSLTDALDDPQVLASGGIVEMSPRPGEDPYQAIASPVDFDGRPQRPGPVPLLGEHTSDVTGGE